MGKFIIVLVKVPKDRREWAREKDTGLESLWKRWANSQRNPSRHSGKDWGADEQVALCQEKAETQVRLEQCGRARVCWTPHNHSGDLHSSIFKKLIKKNYMGLWKNPLLLKCLAQRKQCCSADPWGVTEVGSLEEQSCWALRVWTPKTADL